MAGLAGFQAQFAKLHPGAVAFADLPDDAQLAYLTSIEATPFFGTTKFLTVLGLLALPSYGGNAGKLGWKLVGFVDQHAWEPPFGHYDRGYPGFKSYAKERRSLYGEVANERVAALKDVNARELVFLALLGPACSRWASTRSPSRT